MSSEPRGVCLIINNMRFNPFPMFSHGVDSGEGVQFHHIYSFISV